MTSSSLAIPTAIPWSTDLGPGPEPASIIPRSAELGRPGVLWGDWFGGGVVLLPTPLRTAVVTAAADAFSHLDDLPVVDQPDPDVLGGGWLACLGYSPGRTWLGFYDHLLRWRPERGWTFGALGLPNRAAAYAAALAQAEAVLTDWASPTSPATVGEFGPSEGSSARPRYLAAVEHAITQIRRGEFYQVNLTTRLSADFTGDPTTLFAAMAPQLQPAYGALVPAPRPVLSFSPELFLRVHDRRVTTAPIKGTTASTGPEAEARLRASAKDAAENIMIVDLMRNDLARVSRPGTVVVEDLLGIRPHVGVSHLVSTVAADLRDEVSLSDLLAATFPPGSVTGAPKCSAVRGIAALETQERGAYTGSVGFVTPNAGAEFSVLIRSFELAEERLHLGVGGGITVDSVPLREWEECRHKADPLVRAAGSTWRSGAGADPIEGPDRRGAGVFETLLAQRSEVLRLGDHLARLDRSCRELYGAGIPEDLPVRLRRVAQQPSIEQPRIEQPSSEQPSSEQPNTAGESEDRLALRIDVRPGHRGLQVTVTDRVLGPRPAATRLVHAVRRSGSWRHKWRDRADLVDAERTVGPNRDGLVVQPYFTADGLVTETSRGNLFCLQLDGVWLTPPLDEHLLPGVTRRAVLDMFASWGAPLQIAPVEPALLRSSAGAFWTSSLSGAVAVDAVDGHPIPRVLDLLERLNRGLGLR